MSAAELPAVPIAAELVRERARQIAKGFGPDDEDMHTNGELAQCAASFSAISAACTSRHQSDLDWACEMADRIWLSGPRTERVSDARENLVIAGALIIAEIERLDRRAAYHARNP